MSTFDRFTDPAVLARFLCALGYSNAEVAITLTNRFADLTGDQAREYADAATAQAQESARELQAELDREALAAEFDLSKSTNQPPEIP